MADVTLRLRVDGQQAVVGGIDQVTSALDRNVQGADRDTLALQRNAAAVEQLKQQRALGIVSMREYETQMTRLATQQSAAAQASAEAGAAARAQAAEVEALRTKFDPAFAASQRLTAEQQQLKRALDAGAISQQRYTELLGQMSRASATAGVSMGQIAQATRQLPLQMQDVFVSLQGGQNPLTVFMQQGSQIAGSYGSAGLALRSVGTYIAGMITPLSVGTAVVAGLGYAAYQGAQEHDQLTRSLVLTGNQAGTTAGQLQDSARRVSQSVGTQSQAVEVLSGLISAGVGRGAVNMEALTASAIKLERNGGPAVSSTIKLFAALGEDPVAALKKLSDATGQVEPAVYAQVAALVKLGDTAKAAALAQQEGARITDEQAKALLPTLGWVEQAWQAIADAAGKAKDAVFNLGRDETDAQQAEKTRNVLALKRASLEAAIEAGNSESRYANILRSEISVYEATATAQAKSAARKVDAAAAEGMAATQRRKSVDAEKDWKSITEQNFSLEKKFAEERERIERIGADKGANAKAVADQVAAARRRILGPREDAIAQQNAQYEVALRKITDAELVASIKHRVQMQQQTEESAIKDIAEVEKKAALDRAATLDKLANKEQDPVKRLKAQQDAVLARQEAASTATKAERDLAEMAYKADRAVVEAANNAVGSETQRRQALEESTRAIGIQTAQARQHGIVIDSVATILDREKVALYDTALAQAEINLQDQRAQGLTADKLKGYEDAVLLLTRMRDSLKEVTAASEANDLAKAGLDQTNRLKGQTDPTAPMTDFGNTLRDALGGASSGLGQMVNAMTTLNGLAKEYSREMKVIDDLRNRGDDKNIATARQNEIALVKKQEQAQVGAYASMAGAAASYFGKQTAAYKILHGAEVALRTYQLVMSVQAAAKDLAAIGGRVAAFVTGETTMTGAAVTGSAVRTEASLAEGQANALAGIATQAKGDPYTAFFRIAAMTAIMAGLGFLVGGGSSGPGPAPTNSGTGTVFGDTNAKSESIAKSLDLLNATQDVALTYSRAMAMSLRSIEASMSGVTNIWLRTGGTTGLESGIATGKMDTGLSSVMKFGKELLGPLGNAFGSIVTSLFGKSVSITGSGITADAQSLGGILNGGFKGYNYADVKSTSKFFGISVGSSTRENRDAMDPALERQISGIFSGIGSAVGSAAELLGQDMGSIQQRLQGYVVDLGRIDLKGLDGKQIADKLSAVFGQQADLIAQSVIPGFESLTKVGEGYFETLSRVANEFEVVSTYTRRLGGVMGATGLDAARLSDSLVGLFGGVDSFQTAMSDYYQSFYSDAERTAMTTSELQTAFGQLNVSMPSSEQAFRDLVNAQDKTTDSGRATFAALIQLSPAFHSVTTAATDAAKAAADAAQAIADQRASLQSQLDQALGNTSVIRARELATLDPSNRALQQRIWLLADEKSAYDTAKSSTDAALAGVQRAVDAEKKLTQTRINAAQEQVNTIKSVLSALDSGIKSLMASTVAASQSGQDFIDQALSAAQSTGYLPDPQQLQDAISGATQGLSARVYSTAAEQQADRLSLASRLTDLKKLTGTQLTTAEQLLSTNQQQLTALDGILETARSQVDALRGINTSVLSVTAAVQALSIARAAESTAASSAGSGSSTLAYMQANPDVASAYRVNSYGMTMDEFVSYHYSHYGAAEGRTSPTQLPRFAAGGYYAGGLALVGESGPELINFSQPGQVYTANQTASLLGGDTARLEALIVTLNAQIVELRRAVDTGNRETRRAADALNGNPEQPMLVQTV